MRGMVKSLRSLCLEEDKLMKTLQATQGHHPSPAGHHPSSHPHS